MIDKREPDMFVGTSLADALAARAVAEVVICGFATEGCIDTTVRSAWAKGLRVVVHTTSWSSRASRPHATCQGSTINPKPDLYPRL